ncbi:MAG: hypothetical protein HY897_16745 [Deltaproteobacteria bacterium]|nr:hypothetical protein [Deltaproteobacteria bacterium]
MQFTAAVIVVTALHAVSCTIPEPDLDQDRTYWHHAYFSGDRMDADEAASTEAELATHPDDVSNRLKLLGYFSRHMRLSGNDGLRTKAIEHYLWIVRNRPEAAVDGVGFMMFTQIGGEAHANAMYLFSSLCTTGFGGVID